MNNPSLVFSAHKELALWVLANIPALLCLLIIELHLTKRSRITCSLEETRAIIGALASLQIGLKILIHESAIRGFISERYERERMQSLHNAAWKAEEEFIIHELTLELSLESVSTDNLVAA